MVDVVLMQALLEALPGGCRLVLVGTPHQLPLSGAGKPAVRPARSHRLPTLRLTEIFRQAAASAIIRGPGRWTRGTAPPSPTTPRGTSSSSAAWTPGRRWTPSWTSAAAWLPQNMGIPRTRSRSSPPPGRGMAGTAALEPGPPGGGESPRPGEGGEASAPPSSGRGTG